jgi:hypothetical protein
LGTLGKGSVVQSPLIWAQVDNAVVMISLDPFLHNLLSLFCI